MTARVSRHCRCCRELLVRRYGFHARADHAPASRCCSGSPGRKPWRVRVPSCWKGSGPRTISTPSPSQATSRCGRPSNRASPRPCGSWKRSAACWCRMPRAPARRASVRTCCAPSWTGSGASVAFGAGRAVLVAPPRRQQRVAVGGHAGWRAARGALARQAELSAGS
jgi:hypothetical protein